MPGLELPVRAAFAVNQLARFAKAF